MKTMLMILGIITANIIIASTVGINPAFADCNADHDWPEKPCLDMPPYPKSELVWHWDKYYSMKGHEWMEMKKSEMDYAIDNGILKKWLSFGTQYKNNFQNHNVYFYYFLNDQAPAINGNYFAEQLIQKADRNPDVEKYHFDVPDNNLSDVIMTYYYINNGGLVVLALVTAVIVTGVACIAALMRRKKQRLDVENKNEN